MSSSTSQQFRPINLLCEYLKNPLGIDSTKPRFSWELVSPKRGVQQTAYRIIVANTPQELDAENGGKWDSGKIESSQSTQIPYQGKPLVSGEICYWKIKCWNTDGEESQFSPVATFEMGLLNMEDWQGEWIGVDESISAPMFRKSFTTDRSVKQARAYICGLGYCELHLNGNKAGDQVLTPNWTDYDKREMGGMLYPYKDKSNKRVLYITHDITKMLNQGENAVGVILGNGWYNQRERKAEGSLWYGSPRMILQLNIEYTDGSSESIVSDTSWDCSSSEITFNNIFYGEVVDGRLVRDGWDTHNYNTEGWEKAISVQTPTGILKAQTSPADKIISSISPVAISEPKDGVFVYDMGQNFSGWIKLKVDGAPGTKVVMRFSEELSPEGLLDFQSAGGDNQIQSDTYYLKGEGVEFYEPKFTWHCFRYVELTGCPGKPDLESIEGIVVHSDVEQSGEFSCSNSLFNDIQHIYRWAHLSNMHSSIPSDCPHRERLGYTGDGQLTAETSMYSFWMPQFYTKWINDISDAQNSDSGFVPHTAPFYGGGGGHAWGSAYIIVAWAMYQFYGDRRILEEHYSSMKHWLEYMGTCTENEYIVVHEEEGSWCLGDWCIPKMDEEDDAKLPEPLVNTFVYATVANLMAQIAEVLGKENEAKEFSHLSHAIAAAFHKHFYDENMACYSIGHHGSDAFGLMMKPLSEEIETSVLANLLHTITVKNKGHLDTGIVGTPVLLDVLTEHGYLDTIAEMLMKKTYPGYGYMIENGATTMWETWSGFGSHCHHMFGCVSGWFYKILAGIQTDPAGVGFEKITVRPHVVGNITSINAAVKTLRGRIAVNWQKENGKFSLKAEIPGNSTAKIYLPKDSSISEGGYMVWNKVGFNDGCAGVEYGEECGESVVFTVGSGAYSFECKED